MSLRVTVTDENGDIEEATIPDGDYLVVCSYPCHLFSTRTHANGTHVLTIRERINHEEQT